MAAKNNNAAKNGRVLATILAAAAFAAVTGTTLAQTAEAEFVPGRLLVKMQSGSAAMRSALPGVTSLRPLDAGSVGARSAEATAWFVADLEEGLDIDSAMDLIAERSEVEFVEPDFIVRAPEVVSGQQVTAQLADPGANQQYALSKIEAEAAWQINGGSASVIVAVVDTGVQLDHPDLQAQIWRNPRETMNGIDDDGNGHIDDIAGWNFVSGTNNPNDDHQHGTHVAGIVAAVRNNNTGVAGTADVTIMPVKTLGSDMTGATSDVIEGIRYAINNGANIINLSLSSASPSQAFQDVVNEAAQRNIVVVAAAGNAGKDTLEFPAGFDSVIAVGATDSNDNLANFSNAGPGIEVVAPGVGILSTIPGGQTGMLDGTSMATPYVAGVAALIRSAEPNLSAAQVRERLSATADDLGNGGYDQLFGNGRINARRALTERDGTAPVPTNPGTPNNNNGGDDGFEDNDTAEQAQEIQPGQHSLVCNDEDWFVMAAPGYFAVEILGNGGDLDLAVFDGDGTLLGSSESESSSEFVEGFSSMGAIIIVVAPYEGQTASYELAAITDGMEDFEDDFDNGIFPIDTLPTDNTLIVPVTCGVGAVQMLAAAVIGCVGLGVSNRRRTTRRQSR